MTEPRTSLRSLPRRLLRPVVVRVEQFRDELARIAERQDVLSAQIEQLSRAQDRLAAYQDRFTEEIGARFGPLVETATGATAIVSELVEPGREAQAGLALRNELDHTLRASRDLVDAAVADLQARLADLRSSTRLTQALAERMVAESGRAGAPTSHAEGETSLQVTPASAPPSDGSRFEHAVPGFDLLYRTFEDRHRGDDATITDRQRTDYLELLRSLPNPELPVVDLGCGRGELVQLLLQEGQDAVGVDANLGQLVDGASEHFTQADLFGWLDAREDASARAVVSMHVVEHLPLDLQVRLVFESRRVLAPGGVLVLETPNVLSLSVAASNFWVDPTHERPVHPLFLEFLAEEAGFTRVETRLLHELPVRFRGPDSVKELLDDLDSLILGAGDVALVAWR